MRLIPARVQVHVGSDQLNARTEDAEDKSIKKRENSADIARLILGGNESDVEH